MRFFSTRTISTLAVAGTLLTAAACGRDEPAAPPAVNTATPAPAGAETTDDGVTTSVQARYYGDDQVRGRNVAVVTQAGVVTLRGQVESEAARQRAVALAREVQGVKDVRDELSVRTADTADRTGAGPAAAAERGATGTAGRDDETITPGWITAQIQAQYFINPEVKPWNVDVTTGSDGVVTLEGQVEEAADRTEAVRIAREIKGVTRVEDRLRVKGEASGTASEPAGLERPDVWLTAKIQSKYFLDDLVKLRNIDVETQNGRVTVSGAVASEAERRQAVALARTTEGVRDVTDRLKVDASTVRSGEPGAAAAPLTPVPDLKRPDGWITMKVQSQFFLDPQVKGHEINVDTTRGVVQLKGIVETAEQKQQAEQIARDTEGVTRVVNELTVGKG
ncbi:MAG: BON domain-containing protein [Acidobacteriota bacterium]|nr:BON domain-containing protein [Acidobacteriota bacterium]